MSNIISDTGLERPLTLHMMLLAKKQCHSIAIGIVALFSIASCESSIQSANSIQLDNKSTTKTVEEAVQISEKVETGSVNRDPKPDKVDNAQSSTPDSDNDLISSAVSTSVSGDTYYVSTDGQDDFPGTEDLPYRTIEQGLTQLTPGDALYVLSVDAGKVIRYHASQYANGLADKPITIMGADSVSLQAIDIEADYISVIGLHVIGPGSCAGDPSPITGISYLGQGGVIRGNHVEKTCRIGIELRTSDWRKRDGDDTVDCIIEDNTITRTIESGITITGKRHIVRNNDLSRAVQRQKVSDDSDILSFPDADGIRFFGEDHLIVGNYLHDYRFDKLTITAHIDCFQSWGPAKNVKIDGNTCIADADSYSNVDIDLKTLSDAEQSMLKGAHAKGVQLSAEDDAAGREGVVTDNITISNNIFHGMRGITTSRLPSGGHFTIAHNLFVAGTIVPNSANSAAAIDVYGSNYEANKNPLFFNNATYLIANNVIVDFPESFRLLHDFSGREIDPKIDANNNLVYRSPGIDNIDAVDVDNLEPMNPQLTDAPGGNYAPRGEMPIGRNLSAEGVDTYFAPPGKLQKTRHIFSVGPFPSPE